MTYVPGFFAGDDQKRAWLRANFPSMNAFHLDLIEQQISKEHCDMLFRQSAYISAFTNTILIALKTGINSTSASVALDDIQLTFGILFTLVSGLSIILRTIRENSLENARNTFPATFFATPGNTPNDIWPRDHEPYAS